MSEQKIWSKYLKLSGWGIVVIAILCSLTLWGQRLAAEKNYNNVQISVNYTDVVSMANGNNLSVEEMAALLQERGVTALLFKEVSVGDLLRQGKVGLAVGHNLQQLPYFERISKTIPITDADLFVTLLDNTWTEQVREHLLLKVAGSEFYDGDLAVIKVPIAIPSTNSELDQANRIVTEIGIGFDHEGIALAEKVGMGVIPQIRTWTDASEASLRFVANEVKSLPNLCQILFNDKDLPCGTEAKQLQSFAQMLMINGQAPAPFGTIEFSEQAGLNQLGLLMDKEIIRLHTIANNEMTRLSDEEIMDRWLLAVRERNMRSLLVRFKNIGIPSSSLEENLIYFEQLKENLEASGFKLDETYQKPATININNLLMIFIGLGVAAGILLILLEMNLPRLSLVGLVITAVCWIGLYQFAPIVARKLMALAGVIIFPILSALLVITPQRQRLLTSILNLFKLSAISFIGAILMVGLLADILFMLKLDQFIGVKIAHVIPLAAVPLILYIWQEGKLIEAVKNLLNAAITYKWGLIAAVIAVAGMIYLARTGNTTAELSSVEAAMRSFLNDFMGVRPRSKEFLIGYPLTLLMFYYGATKSKWFLSIGAMIGQVSLVNTYAHIHTALLISLHRSLNGLILGIILGILAIAGMEVLLKLWRKLVKIEQ